MKRNNKQILISSAAGLSKGILFALLLGTIVVAPGGAQGILHVLNKLFDDEKDFNEKQLHNSLDYLKSKKLVDIESHYGKDIYKLTKIGKSRARELMNDFVIEKPDKWDGFMRLVVFDIPVNKKDKADVFRYQLKRLGMANVQKSIWAHPYNCQDQVYYLAGKLGISKNVRFIIAKNITGYSDLRQRFGI